MCIDKWVLDTRPPMVMSCAGLHVERDALDRGEIGPQPAPSPASIGSRWSGGLERNVHAAIVDRAVAAAGPDSRADRADGRIPHDGVEQGLLALGHRLERNILRRLRQADDQSGVLLRERSPLGMTT